MTALKNLAKIGIRVDRYSFSIVVKLLSSLRTMFEVLRIGRLANGSHRDCLKQRLRKRDGH
jgi:hypothetical protein